MKRNEYDKVTNPESGKILAMENLSGLNIEAALDLIGKIIDLSGIHDRPMVPVEHWNGAVTNNQHGTHFRECRGS